MTVGVLTPSSRTRTRFGSVTRIPPLAAPPAIEADTSGHGRSRVSNLRQRRASEKPIRPRCEGKKNDVSLSEESKQLHEKIEELTTKLNQLQSESEDERKRWCKSNQENSQAEFLLEEQRINERESYEKQMMLMQERLESAETRLEACHSALESAGINAINFQGVERFEEVNDLESKVITIGEEIIQVHEKAGLLLSEIEHLFSDDLESSLSRDDSNENVDVISI